MNAEYKFITVWRVPGTIDEVKPILNDAMSLPQWWPAVYLDVVTIKEADENGNGGVVDVFTKGWLPYTLRWRLTITKPITDTGFALKADGDFVGVGVWTFKQDGPEVVITYDWRIQAAKPLLRRLTWLMRPVFSANHVWAMARGEESLRLEMRRRRAATPKERKAVPKPPGPTFKRLVKS